jgi:hypothetical protein
MNGEGSSLVGPAEGLGIYVETLPPAPETIGSDWPWFVCIGNVRLGEEASKANPGKVLSLGPTGGISIETSPPAPEPTGGGWPWSVFVGNVELGEVSKTNGEGLGVYVEALPPPPKAAGGDWPCFVCVGNVVGFGSGACKANGE